MTLKEAIDQLITLGELDPAVIAHKLEDRHGEKWITDQLHEFRQEILKELARRQLGSIRRSAELALRFGDQVTTAELKLVKAWVPGFGWKRAANLTVTDLEARAEWYEKFAEASKIRARWCYEVIQLMHEEGARTLGKLKQALPPLPDGGVEALNA